MLTVQFLNEHATSHLNDRLNHLDAVAHVLHSILYLTLDLDIWSEYIANLLSWLYTFMCLCDSFWGMLCRFVYCVYMYCTARRTLCLIFCFLKKKESYLKLYLNTKHISWSWSRNLYVVLFSSPNSVIDAYELIQDAPLPNLKCESSF